MMQHLRTWFLHNRRDFPWRDNPSPYQVWISEVMLQQTQAQRVIEYYKRWMKRFPTVRALALSSQDDVIKMWEGLGYYSRARALHAAAQDIVTRFNGNIPANAEDLASIKGIGPYTVGAILAFGFKQKIAAVDANVLRVLARYFAYDDDISKTKNHEKFRQAANSLLPDHEPHVIAEAFIELGAAVCTKRPSCLECPLKASCKSYQNGNQALYPVKSQKVAYQKLYRDVAVVECNGSFLVRPGKKGIACSGLFEFPYFEGNFGGALGDDVQKLLVEELELEAEFAYHMDEEEQSFTRYRVTLYPKLFKAKEKVVVAGCEWHTLKGLDKLTFSSGHRRIKSQL